MSRLRATDILQFSVGKLPEPVAAGLRADRPVVERNADGTPIDAMSQAAAKAANSIVEKSASNNPKERRPLSGLVPNMSRLMGHLPKSLKSVDHTGQVQMPTIESTRAPVAKTETPRPTPPKPQAPTAQASTIAQVQTELPPAVAPGEAAPAPMKAVAAAPVAAARIESARPAPTVSAPKIESVRTGKVRPATPTVSKRRSEEPPDDWEPLPSMERPNLLHQTLIALMAAVWLFLLLSLGSFHATDWPSHTVYPYPPIQNLCGPVGAYVAYYAFLAIGTGVFPILFFTGVCITLLACKSRLSDPWLRAIGLGVLSVAFAALVHQLRPGSFYGLPEGHGGIVGIGTSVYLQSHFNTVGTRLILLTAMAIGLLLSADDLVLRTPGFVAVAYENVREHAPQMPSIKLPKFNFKFPELPKFSALPSFRTTDAKSDTRSASNNTLAKPADASPKKKKSSPDEVDSDTIARVRPAKPEKPEKPEIKFAPLDVEPEIEIPAPVTKAKAEENSIPDPAVEDPAPVMAAPEIKRDIVVKLPSMMKPRQVSPPPPPPRELGEYHLPAWDCLEDAEHGYAESQESHVREMAAVLEQALKEFNVDAHVVEIDTGPVITMYELSLAPGLKVSTITSLTNDIMRALRAESVRIVAPVPGKNTVGIEVPNAQKEKVRLKDLMQLAPANVDKAIPLFLGKDASGEPLIADLAAMPHCLIAGTTGSGKSVCINTIIMSIMYLQRPDAVKLVLFDPKVVEMAMYKDIPHLMCPVINDAGRATSVLEWACTKMDERYEFLAEAGVRNIKGYNDLTQEELIERFKPTTPEEEAKIPKKLPYIVIIIDELADLMMTADSKDCETHIVRIAQKARAVGIHLILATQRPSANVVTGLIKSNMPTRIAFRVQSKMDSRIVLDQNGADVLLGHGDMLYLRAGASKPVRCQGTYIDDKEIRDSVKVVKTLADAQYEPELVQIKANIGDTGDMEKDELFDDAVRVVLETKRGSVSLLQRRLTIGYSRASRLIEMMAASGIVGEYKGSQAREATITLEEWEAMKNAENQDAADGMTV